MELSVQTLLITFLPFILIFAFMYSSISQVDLKERAFKFVSAGLDLDQKRGHLDTILQLYQNGIKDLELLLQNELSADQESKIRKTLESVQDRYQELQNQKKRENEMFQSSATLTSPSVMVSPKAVTTPKQPIKRSNPFKSTNPAKAPAYTSKSTHRSTESDKLAHQILDEILVEKPNVSWDSVVGLETAKKALKEIVILPYLRPELFTGLRSPARGVLLFGPPGTGKTMLAKAVATESKAKFFAVSASTLTSKNYGDGEKLVRALFAMARELQPSIIFIDEIDSILTERSDSEHEASRRLKTEFLLQFDGIAAGNDERILLLAASNRPQELDQAALRRMVKRIYIPLPELETRKMLIRHLLGMTEHCLSAADINFVAKQTDGYSSSDITALARESSMGPIRGLGSKLMTTSKEKIRPISVQDFKDAMKIIRPSVSPSYVLEMEKWNQTHGVSVI